MTLNAESFHLPDAPSQRIVFVGATPGSDSAQRLRLLTSLASG
jgi:hypothetical protein